MNMALASQAQFLRRQRKPKEKCVDLVPLGQASAPTPSDENVCLQLGLIEKEPELNHNDFSLDLLALQPWQVTGVAWMANNEDSPHG